MARFSLQLLGGFSFRLGPGPTLNLGTRKAQALIAYLAVPSGRAHPRDKLASLLWGDTGDEQARQSLRQVLVGLRRALPATTPPTLVVDRDTLALDPAAVEVDVQAFERLAAGTTTKDLERAAALYHGDLLEGVRVTEEPFEDWLRAERARLRQLSVDVLTRLLTHQSQANETERAIHTAARLLALDPIQEPVHRTLMRLYARQGRRAEALRQYQLCVSVLQRELRAEPQAETKHLYRELLQQSAPRGQAPAPSPTSATRIRADTAATAPAREGRLIGREVEMAHLRRAWAAAEHGQGQVVVIVGEAGIGKSRLLAELAAEAAQQGGRVLLGHCYESEQILPFAPWVDAVRTGQVIADEAVLEQLNPAWRAELGQLVPEVAGRGGPTPTGARLLLFESVVHVLEQLAAAQPIVLGLEDLHWADELSRRLLAFVARRVRAAPVLVVATVREDEPGSIEVQRLARDELGREPHCSSLTLAALSRADTGALVQTLVRTGEDIDTATARADQVWAISEGNPFVAIETVRALQEGSIPATPMPTYTLPPRIVEVISRRLERLSAEGQELAAVAAVIGREFEFALLQRASGIAEREAALGVEELVRRRVLHGVGDGFDFTHDRIRAAIVGCLLAPRRKMLHARILEAMEHSYADRLDEHVAGLAYHALRGEVREKAVSYLRQSGLKAAARSAYTAARSWFEQALVVLEALPESQSTFEQAFEIRLQLRPTLIQLGEERHLLERLREAEAIAEKLQDARRQGRVCAFVTNVCSMLGEVEEALASGTRALAIARTLEDLELRILTTSFLEQAHFIRGEYKEVAELATDNLAALPADQVYGHAGPGSLISVYDRYWLVMSLAQLGRFAEAAEHGAEAIRLAERRQYAFDIGQAYFAAGTLYVLKGDWGKARSPIERCTAVAKTRNLGNLLAGAVTVSAWVLAQLGAERQAIDLLREGEQLLERQAARGFVAGLAGNYRTLGRACLLLGRLDEARLLGDRAVEFSSGQPGAAAHARQLLGDIATNRDRFDAESSEVHYRQALELAEPRGMRPLVAHCHFGLGKLYRCTGKPEQSREHLITATTMYREMDMRFWLEPAEAEMKELG